LSLSWWILALLSDSVMMKISTLSRVFIIIFIIFLVNQSVCQSIDARSSDRQLVSKPASAPLPGRVSAYTSPASLRHRVTAPLLAGGHGFGIFGTLHYCSLLVTRIRNTPVTLPCLLFRVHTGLLLPRKLHFIGHLKG